jgi:hypothetical protein
MDVCIAIDIYSKFTVSSSSFSCCFFYKYLTSSIVILIRSCLCVCTHECVYMPLYIHAYLHIFILSSFYVPLYIHAYLHIFILSLFLRILLFKYTTLYPTRFGIGNMLDLTEDDCEEERVEIEGHNSLDLPNNGFPSACSSSSSSSSATAIETSYSSHEKEIRRLAEQLVAEQAELNALAQQEPIPLTVSGFKNNLFYAMEKDLRGDQGS